MKTPNFFQRNKVFIIGLLVAALSAIYELTSTGGNPSAWVLGWSVAIAILTYAGRNVRGQSASIISTILMSATSFFQLHNMPNDLNVQEVMRAFVLPLAINILGIFNTSPPKTVDYEHSATIEKAKNQAEEIKNERLN